MTTLEAALFAMSYLSSLAFLLTLRWGRSQEARADVLAEMIKQQPGDRRGSGYEH